MLVMGRMFALLALTAVLVGCAAPAQSDDDDDLFMQVLQDASVPLNRDDATAAAAVLCVQLEQNPRMGIVEAAVAMVANPSLPRMDSTQMGTFIGAAVKTYCPEYWPQLQQG